ncbi:MAG TPA: flagellar hook-associated protein FlgL [Fimbriimonadaceae bacterium]|nr:flagellar hook-associated protein FlgL [Fimbriimonadaceae bacterium]
MRISTGYQYDSYMRDIQLAQDNLTTISQQLATGRRINQPSDDPVGVGTSLSLRSLQSGIQQYMSNLNTAKGSLGYIDNAASSMSDLLNQAYQLAVQGANSSTDQTGRNAMVQQISSLQNQLINIANTQGPNGSYIFAGQKSTTKPYTINAGALVFNGDTKAINVEVGPGQMLQTNVASEPTISTIYNNLEQLKNDLTGGTVGAISGIDITNIQNSLTDISNLRGTVGARMQTVTSMTSQWQIRSDDLTKNISDVEDVDLSAAMVQYQQANQAYTAALTVAGQGSRLSLMDFIQ